MVKGDRDNLLQVRMSDAEMKYFLKHQKASGLIRAEYILKLIDNAPTNEKLISEYAELSKKLEEIKNITKEMERYL